MANFLLFECPWAHTTCWWCCCQSWLLGHSGAWLVLWRLRCILATKNLATVFAVWSGVRYTIMCLVKWSQKTKTLTMCGGWSSSFVISMLVKSTWSSSKGEATRIVCSGSLGKGTFMLNTPLTATDHPLHLHCHIRLPELVPQWAQYSPLKLMFSVPMALIHGHHSVSCGDYKLHSFLQLSGQSMAVIEGTLVECEFLPFLKDGNTLLCHGVVAQKMF